MKKLNLGKFSKYEPDEVFVYGDKLMTIGNRQDEVGTHWSNSFFLYFN